MRLLLADDTPSCSLLLSAFLSSEGHHIIITEDGAREQGFTAFHLDRSQNTPDSASWTLGKLNHHIVLKESQIEGRQAGAGDASHHGDSGGFQLGGS